MYNIHINLIIVTVDLKTTKKYILSKKSDDIVIPRISIDTLNRGKLKLELSEYIRSIIPMNILGIIPQIISLHSQLLTNTYKKLNLYNLEETNIESVYGCLVDHITPIKSDYHWVEFSYNIPNDYSSNIFEVCQYLQ